MSRLRSRLSASDRAAAVEDYNRRRAQRAAEQAANPPQPGLGDMVAAGLSAIGITKERAQAVASAVGVKDCGCRQRQAKLNELGSKYLGLPTGSTPENTG